MIRAVRRSGRSDPRARGDDSSASLRSMSAKRAGLAARNVPDGAATLAASRPEQRRRLGRRAAGSVRSAGEVHEHKPESLLSRAGGARGIDTSDAGISGPIVRARVVRIVNRRRAMACAAAALLIGTPSVSFGSPMTCADVLAKIEKRLTANGVAHPPLKIVPKGVAAGSRVLGSCENGTQRIVYRPTPTASAAGSDDASRKPEAPPLPAKP